MGGKAAGREGREARELASCRQGGDLSKVARGQESECLAQQHLTVIGTLQDRDSASDS
jgi:hypothetical protein